MRRITKMTLFVLALAGLAMLAVFGAPAVMKADDDSNGFSYDVACDCRTGATLDGGVRGSPVHGISSIGDWICRGQVRGSYPPAIAPSYALTPMAVNTQYFILNSGGGMTAEGYDVLPSGERLSVTGGIANFRGARGDIEETPLGTNATGCPNFRAKFRIVRGASD